MNQQSLTEVVERLSLICQSRDPRQISDAIAFLLAHNFGETAEPSRIPEAETSAPLSSTSSASVAPKSIQTKVVGTNKSSIPQQEKGVPEKISDNIEPRSGEVLTDSTIPATQYISADGVSTRLVAATTRGIARALKPLLQKTKATGAWQIDEFQTVERTAEHKALFVVLSAIPEQFFDVVLVVDRSHSMAPWFSLALGLFQMLSRHGAFRNAQLMSFWPDEVQSNRMFSIGLTAFDPDKLVPGETLIDPTGRRTLIVISDCVHSAWTHPDWLSMLERWNESTHLLISHVFPRHLWQRTAVGAIESLKRQSPHQRWVRTSTRPSRRKTNSAKKPTGLCIPIVCTAAGFQQWASAITSGGSAEGAVFAVRARLIAPPTEPEMRLSNFWSSASWEAAQLAAVAAAVPLSLKLLRSLLFNLVPNAELWHLAEFLNSGIVQLRRDSGMEHINDSTQYAFVSEGVRALLLERADKMLVWAAIDQLGMFLTNSAAPLRQSKLIEQIPPDSELARIVALSCKRIGGPIQQGYASKLSLAKQQATTHSVETVDSRDSRPPEGGESFEELEFESPLERLERNGSPGCKLLLRLLVVFPLELLDIVTEWPGIELPELVQDTAELADYGVLKVQDPPISLAPGIRESMGVDPENRELEFLLAVRDWVDLRIPNSRRADLREALRLILGASLEGQNELRTLSGKVQDVLGFSPFPTLLRTHKDLSAAGPVSFESGALGSDGYVTYRFKNLALVVGIEIELDWGDEYYCSCDEYGSPGTLNQRVLAACNIQIDELMNYGQELRSAGWTKISRTEPRKEVRAIVTITRQSQAPQTLLRGNFKNAWNSPGGHSPHVWIAALGSGAAGLTVSESSQILLEEILDNVSENTEILLGFSVEGVDNFRKVTRIANEVVRKQTQKEDQKNITDKSRERSTFMPWTREQHTILRTELSFALPWREEQVEFVKNVPLDFTRIPFHGVPMLSWEAILVFAANQGKIQTLLEKAIEYFPANQTLRTLLAGQTPVEPPHAVGGAWKGVRTTHSVFGKQNTFVDVNWLQQGWNAARAVCRVWVNGTPKGTGFLTSHNRIVTNFHVLENQVVAANSEVEFDYQAGGTPQKFPLDGTVFRTGGNALEGDWTIAGVKGEPETSFGALPLRMTELNPDTWVNIIQHPNCGMKQLSYSGNLVRWVGTLDGTGANQPTLVHYLTDTLPGSSGSPVFDKHWNVVALHHAEFRQNDVPAYEQIFNTERAYARNEGILLSHILRSISS